MTNEKLISHPVQPALVTLKSVWKNLRVKKLLFHLMCGRTDKVPSDTRMVQNINAHKDLRGTQRSASKSVGQRFVSIQSSRYEAIYCIFQRSGWRTEPLVALFIQQRHEGTWNLDRTSHGTEVQNTFHCHAASTSFLHIFAHWVQICRVSIKVCFLFFFSFNRRMSGQEAHDGW